MVRGIKRRPIFVDDTDRFDLLERLCDLVPDCGATFYGWVFIPNHLHFIVRSGHDPLTRLMRRLNTGFAVRFNLRHDRAGYLFQNRFRSRLVTGDDDLQGLIRYVHLNPLRAGLVPDLDALARWRWSGHGALMGHREALSFEDVAASLSLFDSQVDVARQRLRQWMRDGLDGTAEPAAVETKAALLSAERRSPPPVDAVVHPGSFDALIEGACRYYGASIQDLQRGARSDRVASARALICHVAVTRWRLPTGVVAKVVGVTPAAVSQALSRGGRLASEDLDRIGVPARRVT